MPSLRFVNELTEEAKQQLEAIYHDHSDYGFRRVQGSLYTCENEDMANLTDALDALRDLPWFPQSVRDIRAFRIEQWSDFTNRIKRHRLGVACLKNEGFLDNVQSP
jgi:virulence-associated protein VapD